MEHDVYKQADEGYQTQPKPNGKGAATTP